MIIAIDGYEANISQRVGIGRYAYEILNRIYTLVENNAAKQTIDFRIYIPEKLRSDMPQATSWWQYRISKPKFMWTWVGLPIALILDRPKADAFFSPTHYVPRFTNIPRVMSVMDLSYVSYPSLFKTKDLHKLTHWTKYSLVHSEAILTISHFTKNAIIQKYGVDADHIFVTYPGFSVGNKKVRISMKKLPFILGKPYILSVGTIQPRKNYSRLIEAFSYLVKQGGQKYQTLNLFIVGKKGWLYEDIFQAPKRYSVEHQVKFLDFIEDDVLPLLYKHALCFVLPSLYEGFGLPVLEAMAYKCPVVVSNTSSLPEIAGIAGIYVDPNDVRSISEGLKKSIRDRNQKQGKERIIAGLQQVKKFSWEHAARETLQILETIASHQRQR